MSARNEHEAPPHHASCVVIHSTRRYPCFPTSKDAFTLRQKQWLQENKENIPPEDHSKKKLLPTQTAFNKKYWTLQDRSHVEEEDSEHHESKEE